MKRNNEAMYKAMQVSLQFDIDVQHLRLTVEDLLSQYTHFGYYKGLLLFTKEYAPTIRQSKFSDIIKLQDDACFYRNSITGFHHTCAWDEKLHPIDLLREYLPNRKHIIDDILADLETDEGSNSQTIE
ncbi:hypothetical protein KBK19_14170 [Microvirga sp. STR05]|uniref:Uncharacterized protein n=1 Tax=Hymenobacter duratus TaxID=2771356 RepID=A0ABR8JNT4_9BACT|nr:hypothetical protein [Hymenobacter duratus]MBD2716184.1 hypothetical protein [Hymenobacter duratus]MBR7951098.1 hypothetical protein [Microvirga sp. STR05]